MADKPLVTRIVEWLRAGYPDGVPQRDYVPLLALLRRQLTEDEVTAVSAELIAESAPATADPTSSSADEPGIDPISRIDAGVKITHVTQEMPHDADLARVRDFLHNAGWPFDDAPLRPSSSEPGNPSSEPGNPSSESSPNEDQP